MQLRFALHAGFRYTARAVHRILEEEEQAAATAWAESAAGRTVAAGRSGAVATAVSSDGKTVVTSSAEVTTALLPLPLTLKGAPPSGWPRRLATSMRQLTHAILRRINYAAGTFQMFGSLADVVVLAPVSARDAVGFTDVGPLAALRDPWSFYDPTAETSIVMQMPPPGHEGSSGAAAAAARSRARSDAALDAALTSYVLEEVPMRLAREKSMLWREQLVDALAQRGRSLSGASGLHTGVEWIAVTLEFGSGSSSAPDPAKQPKVGPNGQVDPVAAFKARAEWARDPFSLLRANVSLWDPENSHFLHPVLRYYNTAYDPESPAAELHLIEDVATDW